MNSVDLIFLIVSWQMFNLGVWQNYIAGVFPLYPYNIAAIILIYFSLFYLKRREIDLGNSGFSKKDFWAVLVSLGALLAVLLPIGFRLEFLRFNPRLDFNFIGSTVLGYVLFVAPAEELVFRGIILNLLRRKFKNFLALVVSSFFFAIIYTHFCGGGKCWNLPYMGLAFVAGMVYGISYLKSKNILVPILVHGLTDSIWRIFFS